MIILNERHLKRLMSSFLLYYHEDRTHLGLAKDTPAGRATEIRSAGESRIQSFRESAGCTIVMRWQRRFKSCFSESQILILKPGQAHSTLSASIFADRRISPPTSVKEKEIHPFNVVHDDLANYRTEFSGPTDFLACAELVDTPSYRISFC